MNIFVRSIGEGTLPPEPDKTSTKLDVEDNIGESIHIHIRNARFEFTIEDFLKFAEAVEQAETRLNNGDY